MQPAVAPLQWMINGWLAWQRWTEAANEWVGSRKSFGMALESHGYRQQKSQDIAAIRAWT